MGRLMATETANQWDGFAGDVSVRVCESIGIPIGTWSRPYAEVHGRRRWLGPWHWFPTPRTWL